MNLISSVVYAADTITINKPANFALITDLGKLISNAISLLMIVAAIATFFYLVWGGLEWITSGGEKAGTESAKNKITNAFIGLVIVFSAWAIMNVFEKFFGICILGCPINIPTP
jgi:hypothetical protein